MSAKHTPGPWKMRETYSNGEPNGCVIEPMRYELTTSNNDENYANARLIAAAPEMLEALRAFTASWDAYHADEGIYNPHDQPAFQEAVEGLYRVMEKAEGK